MIWNEKYDCMASAELKQVQSERLKQLAAYVYENCKVYKDKFDKTGIKPDAVHSIDDIKRLPFTNKIDMRDNYPYGLFSTEQKEVKEIHVSSGTIGNPHLSVIQKTI